MFQAAPKGPPLAHSRSDSSRLLSAVEWQSKPVTSELGPSAGADVVGVTVGVTTAVADDVVSSAEPAGAGAQLGGASGLGDAAVLGVGLVVAQPNTTTLRPTCEVQSSAFMAALLALRKRRFTFRIRRVSSQLRHGIFGVGPALHGGPRLPPTTARPDARTTARDSFARDATAGGPSPFHHRQ